MGAVTAAPLLITAGANPERLCEDAALAALRGASPVRASSGKISRHRLNRGGDRTASNALWGIAHVRTISDPRTSAFVAKRTATPTPPALPEAVNAWARPAPRTQNR